MVKAPRGFLDSEGNELEICKYTVWFDLGETVWYYKDKEKQNIATHVSLTKKDTLQSLIDNISKRYTKKDIIDIDDEDDFYADKKISSYANSSEDEGKPKVREVKTPMRRKDAYSPVNKRYKKKTKPKSVKEIPLSPDEK